MRCVYDSASETLVHLTKEVVTGFTDPCGGAYGDAYQTETNGEIVLKIGLNRKALHDGDYVNLIARGLPAVGFARAKQNDQFQYLGLLEYVPNSFKDQDEECVRTLKNGELEKLPSLKLKLLNLTAPMVAHNPMLLPLRPA